MTGYLGATFTVGEQKIQCSYYIRRDSCAQPGCSTMLLWNDNGSMDASLCFCAEKCRCDELFEEDRTLCCAEHKATYICPDCNSEEDEEEERTATKRRLEELEQEVRSLKQKLEK